MASAKLFLLFGFYFNMAIFKKTLHGKFCASIILSIIYYPFYV